MLCCVKTAFLFKIDVGMQVKEHFEKVASLNFGF